MGHGGKIQHERGRSKIIDRGVVSLLARGEHCFFQRGDRKLSICLTERNESNTSGYQIGGKALQEGWQSQINRNVLPCRSNSNYNSHRRRNMAFAKYFV